MARFGEIAAALGCAVLLVACSFSADYTGTRYQCGPSGECPDGYACAAGFCEVERAPGADGGGSGSDGGGGGGGGGGGADAGGGGTEDDAGSRACPSASALRDDFSTDAAWTITNRSGCVISFDTGQVEMSAVGGRCNARTIDSYALDGRVFVQAVDPAGGITKVGFGIFYGEASLVAFRVIGGIDLVVLLPGGGQSVVDSFPFDPELDGFWGFRPEPGTGLIHWETSADGLEWSDRGLYPPPGLAEDGCVGLEFHAVGTGTTAPSAAFDNLNLPEGTGPGVE
ncbi:MAG TPA: hypothetical protein VKB80_08170 [Kofleriaceae bacterium]|nr:hypothetical protein [Kofleriaceae bacterium]